MDNEHNAPMQVDPSTYPVSAIQAFKLDPSTEWVIESAPGFVAIKHKIGCLICDASASHCMAAKRSYEIHLDEKEVTDADHNILKETAHSAETMAEKHRVKINELYEKLNTHRATIKTWMTSKELILENKHLQQELDYYVRRARYALWRKNADWATRNGYRISDIPVSDGEDDDEDQAGLPTMPEEIPQDRPSQPSTRLAHTVGKSHRNNVKVVPESGIPAIGSSRFHSTHKRIIANPPASITGVLPKPLGKVRAVHWDQPALRGAADWVMESDVHDSEMHRLYIEGRALQPHLRSSDHTAVMFHIDEYARSLPGLPRNLVVRHNKPDWMINVVQTFNTNPSGIPRNLRLEGLHVNVDDADVWYWFNLIKPKFRGTDTEIVLQLIFSTVGKWDQMISGQWKKNDSPFLCSPPPARYEIHCQQKFDWREFAYWLGVYTGVTPALARNKLEPYFVHHGLVEKCGFMNQFRVHDALLPLVRESPYYFPPSVEKAMDQDETDPDPNPIQHAAGSSSLADRLDYGEGGSFSCPPADARELQARVSYYNSLVPQGTAHESTAEITEALTHDLYMDNLE
ncbi:hypothetical protein M422DRAFT_273579 [Sphaerobolus stellatus SS14]|uniref:Uncharacterized protein n=1 Tax=Sphaerobolus stellatus (strain SS14) TaxID=990650 RepID=A0A0C9UJQ4_SPHS4|nr:hypothetical protein M422DRAFT_273579 [Sphaerobolus stellatus SS14]